MTVPSERSAQCILRVPVFPFYIKKPIANPHKKYIKKHDCFVCFHYIPSQEIGTSVKSSRVSMHLGSISTVQIGLPLRPRPWQPLKTRHLKQRSPFDRPIRHLTTSDV